MDSTSLKYLIADVDSSAYCLGRAVADVQYLGGRDGFKERNRAAYAALIKYAESLDAAPEPPQPEPAPDATEAALHEALLTLEHAEGDAHLAFWSRDNNERDKLTFEIMNYIRMTRYLISDFLTPGAATELTPELNRVPETPSPITSCGSRNQLPTILKEWVKQANQYISEAGPIHAFDDEGIYRMVEAIQQSLIDLENRLGDA